MLGGQTESTFIVANALRSRFGDFPLIVEDPQSGWTVARRRARRLGVAAVAGQLLFIALSRLISLRSRPRIEEIRRLSGLDSTPVTANVVRVPSVNGDEALRC